MHLWTGRIHIFLSLTHRNVNWCVLELAVHKESIIYKKKQVNTSYRKLLKKETLESWWWGISTQGYSVVRQPQRHGVLGMIKRNFRRLDEEDYLIIYKTYVRPHLEYCIQVWCLHPATDILCLEKIQRAATKIVSGLKKLEYGDRLKRLGLTALETRRKRGDLIET